MRSVTQLRNFSLDRGARRARFILPDGRIVGTLGVEREAVALRRESESDRRSMAFTLRLLGGASLSDDMGPVVGQAAQKRRVGLLALLALAPNASISRDKVIAYLWPESTMAEARHLLSVALHALRQTLGDDVIQSAGDDLRLNASILRSDIAEFEQKLRSGDVEGAVALYAGPLLDGFYLSDAQEFMEWTDSQRAHVADRYAHALDRAAEEREQRGNLVGAVELWRKRSLLDPFNARIALRYMRAMVAAGDRAGALQHARVYEAALRREFGTKPEVEIARYVDQLQALADGQSPVLSATTPSALPNASAILATDVAVPATESVALPSPRMRPSVRVLVGIALAVVGSAYGTYALVNRAPVLDDNRVLVFPLVDHSSAAASTVGEEVTIALGAALEQTEPLQWLDAWQSLTAAERADPRAIDSDRQEALTRQSGARYYMNGSISRISGDSALVRLRLVDMVADSIVKQASVRGVMAGDGAVRAAIAGLNRLLPAMIAPGVRELSAAVPPTSNAAALANWLRGERDYRRARYREALEAFDVALSQDSSFATAALRAAKAARWLVDDRASTYIAIALRDTLELSPKQRFFARGVSAYLKGQADSALAQFARAIELDPQWSEAHVAAGEVYFSLFPSAGALDSLAEFSFAQAVRASPDFVPARYMLALAHLTRGNNVLANEEFRRYRELSSDSGHVHLAQLALSCAQGDARSIDWKAEAAERPEDVAEAARILSIAGRHMECAEKAYRALFESADLHAGLRWLALQGLHAVYMATRRYDDVRKLQNEAIVAGVRAAPSLLIVAAMEGAPFDDRAFSEMKVLEVPLASMGAARLWYFGAWYAHRKVVDSLALVADRLSRLAEQTRDRRDRLIARAIQARLYLARGDTVGALAILAALRPNGPPAELDNYPYEALGAERLELARLLEARGEYAEAIRAAEAMDHPQPRWYLPLLPESLRIRLRAARKLGLDEKVREYERRLGAFGRP